MCHRAKKASHCASAYKQTGSTKNMWTAMLYSKHMWVWMVLGPLSDLKLSGCQDKEAPRFCASLFFILLIRSSIFPPFPFFNGPFGKDVPRHEEQKLSNGNRTVLFERHYSSNNSHLERNLFLYLQQCPFWSTIEQLWQLCHCALGSDPESSGVGHSHSAEQHKGLKVWVTWLTNVNEWWKLLNDCHYRRNH